MAKVLNMYQLKPIIDPSVTVSVSKCMYKMKNIHEQNESINHVQTKSSVLDISDKNQQILPEMAELEERQKKILEQLELLKNQMQNLRSELKLCSKPGINSTNLGTSQQLKFENLADLESISLKIHPNYIPYYLLAVRKLWKGFIQMIFTVHVHSSVNNLPEANRKFSKLLTETTTIPNIPQLNVTIIWKEVECNSELVVSSMRVPIIGETNILRYLSRIDNSQNLKYEVNNLIQTLVIDNLLDLCYRLSQCSAKTEKQQLLRMIHVKLGKSTWLADTTDLSIADIALYSILNQQNLIKELNVNMSNWLQRYQQLVNKLSC